MSTSTTVPDHVELGDLSWIEQDYRNPAIPWPSLRFCKWMVGGGLSFGPDGVCNNKESFVVSYGQYSIQHPAFRKRVTEWVQRGWISLRVIVFGIPYDSMLLWPFVTLTRLDFTGSHAAAKATNVYLDAWLNTDHLTELNFPVDRHTLTGSIQFPALRTLTLGTFHPVNDQVKVKNIIARCGPQLQTVDVCCSGSLNADDLFGGFPILADFKALLFNGYRCRFNTCGLLKRLEKLQLHNSNFVLPDSDELYPNLLHLSIGNTDYRYALDFPRQLPNVQHFDVGQVRDADWDDARPPSINRVVAAQLMTTFMNQHASIYECRIGGVSMDAMRLIWKPSFNYKLWRFGTNFDSDDRQPWPHFYLACDSYAPMNELLTYSLLIIRCWKLCAAHPLKTSILPLVQHVIAPMCGWTKRIGPSFFSRYLNQWLESRFVCNQTI